MRNSPLRHPLAVLRTKLGLTQKEMADLVGRAARTIQSVELGKMPLSEGLARLIAKATGVGVGWLLEGDSTAPPRQAGGVTYTRDDFERHRAGLEEPHGPCTVAGERDRQLVTLVQGLLRDTMGAPDGDLIRWKLRRYIASLSSKNGSTEPKSS